MRRLLLTVVAGLLIIGTIVTISYLLETYLVVENPLNRVDALVVMAGSPHQRLPAIVRLYKQGIAPTILLTNDGIRGPWSPIKQRNLFHVEWAKEYLLQEGVPPGAIEILDYTSSGSVYDAIHTRNRVVADGNVSSLLVVTSDYHTRRTLWIFQRVFEGEAVSISVFPVVVEDSKYNGRRPLILAEEFIKLIYYKLKYSEWSHCFGQFGAAAKLTTIFVPRIQDENHQGSAHYVHWPCHNA